MVAQKSVEFSQFVALSCNLNLSIPQNRKNYHNFKLILKLLMTETHFISVENILLKSCLNIEWWNNDLTCNKYLQVCSKSSINGLTHKQNGHLLTLVVGVTLIFIAVSLEKCLANDIKSLFLPWFKTGNILLILSMCENLCSLEELVTIPSLEVWR